MGSNVVERSARRVHPREVPAYGLTEAAHYLRLPTATLRVWTMGQGYRVNDEKRWAPAIIQLPDSEKAILSFVNLIEAHVLRALRTRHGISMPKVRQALEELERHDAPTHPLAFENFLTGRGELFVKRYGELVNLSRAGQIAMTSVLAVHLDRVERDEMFAPIRLYPFVRSETSGDVRTVLVDPEVSFGRPVIRGTRIATAEIRSRINAGETVAEVAEDLGQSEEALTQAILYEEAA
jgi:uncharacterized protein (DUF433 family)